MTNFFNKLIKLLLAHFWSIFPILRQRIYHSYGFLKALPNLEKTNDPILRKHPDRLKDGKTDRSINPFPLQSGVQKVKKKVRLYNTYHNHYPKTR